MIALFQWLWERLQALFGLVLPMLGRAAEGFRSVVFWVLHGLIVLGILAGLTWANGHFDLPRYLRAPTAWLAEIWLPLLFLILYVNLWLGWALWKLSRPEQQPSPFPDIDAAWDDACDALARAGLDLRRVPLYLVLGRPRSGEEALFDTARLKLNPLGTLAQASLRVFAGRDAIFVCATDCSLAGGLAAWAQQFPAQPQENRDEFAPSISTPQARLPTTKPKPSLFPPLMPPTKEETGPEEEADSEPQAAAPMPPLTKNLAEMERLSARLAHLCERIRRQRAPYCGLNGLLAVVPEVCTRSEAQANQAALLIGRDIRLAVDVLQVRCPVVSVISDGEHLPGVEPLLRLLPRDKRAQRLGKKLPYAPNITPAQRAEMIERAVRWQWGTLIPRLIYRVLPSLEATVGRAEEISEELFRLMVILRERQEILARLFSRMLVTEPQGSVWVGGCYLAATGTQSFTNGFLADVFSQMLESQNFVAWTDGAKRQERRYQWWTLFGYLGIAAVLGGTVALAWYVFFVLPRLG